MIFDVTLFAETAERADLKWGGSNRDIPLLELAGAQVHLSHLGADLAPWLLALSDRLAEFAATVAADGTKRGAKTAAELVEQSQASAEADRRARLDAGLARWSK